VYSVTYSLTLFITCVFSDLFTYTVYHMCIQWLICYTLLGDQMNDQ